MTVKLPTGLREAELSRPVIEVRDFLTGELDIELGIEFTTTWKPYEESEQRIMKMLLESDIIEFSKVEYRVTISGRGGFRILEEKLSIPEMNTGIVCLEGNCIFSYEGVKYDSDLYEFGYRNLLEVTYESFRVYSYEDRRDWESSYLYVDCNV